LVDTIRGSRKGVFLGFDPEYIHLLRAAREVSEGKDTGQDRRSLLLFFETINLNLLLPQGGELFFTILNMAMNGFA
jgi:hypothetical protein